MPVSPGEFLKSLKKGSLASRVLCVVYYLSEHRDVATLTSSDVIDVFRTIRDRQSASGNVSQALITCAQSGFVHNTGTKRGREILWEVTDTGRAEVRNVLGIVVEPDELEKEVNDLTVIASRLSNADVRDYLQEGIDCLRVRAMRASIVFVWSGAIRLIQARLMDSAYLAGTLASLKALGVRRPIATIDDWSYVEDSQTLRAAKDVGLFSKTQHQTISQGLVLRNQCGHPSNVKPSTNKTKSYLEELSDLVFSRFA